MQFLLLNNYQNKAEKLHRFNRKVQSFILGSEMVKLLVTIDAAIFQTYIEIKHSAVWNFYAQHVRDLGSSQNFLTYP